MTILITGANGKLGRALIAHLASTQPVHAAARAMPMDLPPGVRGFAVGPLNDGTDWAAALAGVTAVIHCAALTWVAPETGNEGDFKTVNVDATVRLARQAVTAGVARFVYVSSLTVNGKHSGARPFRHDDLPDPQSTYSKTKWEAEQALRAIGKETGLEVVIVRPPRIIWPELSGNLRQLAGLIRRGIPLPFGALNRNARDNVSAPNLVALIAAATEHPGAAGETFLASDGDPLSTRALLLRLGRHVGRPARLVPVPQAMLRAIIAVAPQRLRGRLSATELADELMRDLRVDIAHTHAVLGWAPERGVLAP